MDDPYPFLRFDISSRAFLSRAAEHLVLFEKNESPEDFFYAALNLRFGIEARLNEYLVPALRSIGKDKKSISDYVATKLLKSLLTIDRDADRPSTLHITCEQDGIWTAMQFTPVSKDLAEIHGRLGELLHFKFFTNNEHWVIRKPLGGSPHHSVADFVPLLHKGISELRQATSGPLLSNPKFTQFVENIVKEAPDERPTSRES